MTLATSEGAVAGFFAIVTVGGFAESVAFSSTQPQRLAASNAPDKML
jgi:hypothetical protein